MAKTGKSKPWSGGTKGWGKDGPNARRIWEVPDLEKPKSEKNASAPEQAKLEH